MLYNKKWDKEVTLQADLVGKVLGDAADYMDQHGWSTKIEDLDGKVCIVGAIWKVVQDVGIRRKAIERLITHLGVPSVIDWNDKNDGTLVIEATRAAAAVN